MSNERKQFLSPGVLRRAAELAPGIDLVAQEEEIDRLMTRIGASAERSDGSVVEGIVFLKLAVARREATTWLLSIVALADADLPAEEREYLRYVIAWGRTMAKNARRTIAELTVTMHERRRALRRRPHRRRASAGAVRRRRTGRS